MRVYAPLQAVAASARLANIPSVISNVWLGIAVAVWADGWPPDGQAVGRAAWLVLAGVGLYLAGSFLNDWADRDWDTRHRPERALPRAVVPAGYYLTAALGCLALGCGAAATVHRASLLVALLIGLCIVVYTLLHKRSAWAVVAMGLCRALLPVLGFSGFVAALGTPAAWLLGGLGLSAGGVFCYVAGLSLRARGEALAGLAPKAAGGIARWAVAAAVAMTLAVRGCLALPFLTCLPGLLSYGLWLTLCLTVFRQPVRRQVSNLLAGIPLLDWIVLLPLAMAGGAVNLAVICLVLPPLAVVGGKLLQRLAPAT